MYLPEKALFTLGPALTKGSELMFPPMPPRPSSPLRQSDLQRCKEAAERQDQPVATEDRRYQGKSQRRAWGRRYPHGAEAPVLKGKGP